MAARQYLAQLWWLFPAIILDERAAGVKLATRWRIDRTGHIALQNCQPVSASSTACGL